MAESGPEMMPDEPTFGPATGFRIGAKSDFSERGGELGNHLVWSLEGRLAAVASHDIVQGNSNGGASRPQTRAADDNFGD
jgi:hypothetical protein